MIDKLLLTGAFEKMGPERVERMLLAFGPDGDTLSYCRCALGFAGGFEGHCTRQHGHAGPHRCSLSDVQARAR